jgi:hypothetical protein
VSCSKVFLGGGNGLVDGGSGQEYAVVIALRKTRGKASVYNFV